MRKINKKTVKMNILSIALLIFLLISTLSLSTFAMETESVVDDFGDTISLNKSPEKIISMSPNITELLYAIGLGEKVIAVSEECNYPEQMLQAKENEEIESIGFTNEPNIEKIIEMEADLVIADNINPKENVKRLKELGINVLALSPKDFDSSFAAIEKIGKITANQDEAKKLIENMKNDIAKIEKLLNSQNKRPSVFMEIWSEPIITAGGETFMNEIITLAGGKNIGAEAGNGWPQYNLEKILTSDPEVYLISTHSTTGGGTPDLAERENFSSLTAIKEDRVYIIDQNRISRPGPRAVAGLVELVKYFYPELEDELKKI